MIILLVCAMSISFIKYFLSMPMWLQNLLLTHIIILDIVFDILIMFCTSMVSGTVTGFIVGILVGVTVPLSLHGIKKYRNL